MTISVKHKGNTLLCPQCGGNNLHQERADIGFRMKEDGPGLVTSCNAKGSATTAVDQAAIVGRRHAMHIDFTCEQCGGGLIAYSLCVMQHKGLTLIGWVLNKDSVSSA